MWVVANQLEDPFGSDDNDLPMIGYHEHFCATLTHMLDSAWMSKDTWLKRSKDGTTSGRDSGNESQNQPDVNARKRHVTMDSAITC